MFNTMVEERAENTWSRNELKTHDRGTSGKHMIEELAENT